MTTTNEQISTVNALSTLASDTLPGAARRITLPSALKLDAVVSGANGAAYLVAAGPLGDLLGIAPALLRVLGAVLVLYAAVLVLIATRRAIPRPVGLAIVTANAAWAIGSIVVVGADWTAPTTAGAVWIVAQALVVAGFAELQAMALKR